MVKCMLSGSLPTAYSGSGTNSTYLYTLRMTILLNSSMNVWGDIRIQKVEINNCT